MIKIILFFSLIFILGIFLKKDLKNKKKKEKEKNTK